MNARLAVTIAGITVFLCLCSVTTSLAQEAVLSGVVKDSTGGVLPGVTITGQHEATGNAVTTVTDDRGQFRIPARIGIYRITAELQGFSSAVQRAELLVGQQAFVNLEMRPSTVTESITVTGEAPLIDVTSSVVAGNIDQRQMQELPVNGRNWQSLALLAPGNRANAISEAPVERDQGNYQINIDGQQMTNNVAGAGFGQPRFSRDAIAEFQFVSNQFDATQGRSSGVQVNAVTKSGTNNLSGSFSGYFRSDKWTAEDFVARRVLPYNNQQLSTTLGGPIRRDRIHYFANYEYEREPQTYVYTTPFPKFNTDLTGTRTEQKGGVRFDFQLPGQTHLATRANAWRFLQPYDPRYTGGGDKTPSSAIGVNRYSKSVNNDLTQVLSNRSVNQVRIGYAQVHWEQYSHVRNPTSPTGTGFGVPSITLRGLTIGQTHTNTPQRIGEDNYSFRDDFTTTLGGHSVKAGGEYLYDLTWLFFCNNCIGQLDVQGGPIPANIESLFPNMMDASTWNLAPLSPLVRRFTATVGDFNIDAPRHRFAGWLQDDWALSDRLTLNLGLRYDLAKGMFAEYIALQPFLSAGRPLDKDNIQPRVGFNYKLDDRTVVRGGAGKYYSEVQSQPQFWTIAWSKQVAPTLLPDGRSDFASNPWNGPVPTFEQALRIPGLRRAITSQLVAPDAQVPFSYQTSLGVQRQIGEGMSVQADYVYVGMRHILLNRNINLAFDPTTGVNYRFDDFARLPYPDWGVVQMSTTIGRSNTHSLQTAWTKRFSRRWQAQATYTLSTYRDDDPLPNQGLRQVTFQVAPDLGGEYGLAQTDQRHRAVFSGIWEGPAGLQLSGLYFYGSGLRYGTSYGGDLRGTGGSGGRLRPNGTIVPRNAFVGSPVHRVDMRVQRRTRLGGRLTGDAILELFNVFNHENYGAYTTQESNANYGRPASNTAVEYKPRMMQLGFRLAF